jgi:hypothetical protein
MNLGCHNHVVSLVAIAGTVVAWVVAVMVEATAWLEVRGGRLCERGRERRSEVENGVCGVGVIANDGVVNVRTKRVYAVVVDVMCASLRLGGVADGIEGWCGGAGATNGPHQ